MANIQPVEIWSNGSIKTADVLIVESIRDNFQTFARISWQLKEADSINQDGNIIFGSVLSSGNLDLEGQDYIDWASEPGTSANEWAINWTADQINVTII